MLRHKEAPVLAIHLVLVALLTNQSGIQAGGQEGRDLGWERWPEVVVSFEHPLCLDGGSQAAVQWGNMSTNHQVCFGLIKHHCDKMPQTQGSFQGLPHPR